MESERRVEVVYRGRVQGVGFRATVAEAARACGVTGWVRNEADGTVRLEAQGGAGALEEMFDRIERRMGAHIEGRVDREASAARGEDGFEIRR